MQSLGYESKNDTQGTQQITSSFDANSMRRRIFTMLAELDKDGNASLDFEEFLDLMSGKEGKEEKDTKARLRSSLGTP